MNCGIDIKESLLGKALARKAKQQAVSLSYFTTLRSIGFQEWYSKTYGKPVNLDATDKDEIKQLVDVVVDYHDNHIGARASMSIQPVDKSTAPTFTQQYTDVAAREFAKQHIAQLILEIEREGSLANSADKIKDYRAAVLRKYLSIAAGRIASRQVENDTELNDRIKGMDVVNAQLAVSARYKELLESAYNYMTGKLNEDLKTHNIPLKNQRKVLAGLRYDYLKKNLGERNGAAMSSTEQDVNLAALIYEMTLSPRIFAEVVDRNGNVNKLFVKDSTFGELADIARLDESSSIDDSFNEEVGLSESTYDKDMSYIVYDSHSGFYTSYDKHVDDDVKVYLSTITQTLPRATVAGEEVYPDTNNPLGVEVNMDYHNLVNFLFTTTSKTSYADFVESIKVQARFRPRFSGVVQLVKDIENNPSLGAKLFRIFGKNVMPKLQLSSNDTYDFIAVSNRRTDLKTCLYFEFLNSFKTTGLLFNTDTLAEDIKSIDRDIRNEDFGSAKSKMIKAYTQLFPSIDTYALLVAMEDENNNGFYNMRTMLSHIHGTATAYSKEYYNKEKQIDEYRKKNKNRHINYAVIREIREAPFKVNIEETIDNFVSVFNKYCNVKIDLNSANAIGNKSSDIANDNWITSRINTLQSPAALRVWGEYLIQSTQFDKNPILFTQYNENGEAISKGIFDFKNGLEVNPDAADIIRFYLFDGAKNEITKEGVMYANMTSGDYQVAQFKMFFKGIDGYGEDTEGKVASYFLRTPSDAPRNYNGASARYPVHPKEYTPKYDSNGEILQDKNAPLFIPQGVESVKRDLRDAMFRMYDVEDTTDISFNEAINKNLDKKGKNVDVSVFASYLVKGAATSSGSLNVIPTKDKNKKIKKYSYAGYDLYILFDTKLVGDTTKYSNGVPVRITKNGKTVTDAIELPADINSFILNQKIENHEPGVSERINRQHPIFTLLYNSVVQELTDAATALDVIFKTEADGRIRTTGTSGQLPFREGFNENSDDNDNLFRVYHLGQDKDYNWKLFTYDANGQINGLAGRVFKFDNLTVDDFSLNDVIKNVVSLIPSTGELHYDTNYLHTGLDRNGRFTVVLTQAQKDAISRGIEEFIVRLTNRKLNNLKSVERFIGKEITRDEAADIALNYYITYLGYDGMLEGNPKFYKNMDDFIKRAKEVQAGGIPYFLKNLLSYAQQDSRVAVDSRIDPLASKNWGIRLKPYFNAVTVKNTIQTHEKTIEDMSKLLDAAYAEEGYTPAQRQRKIERQFANGYRNTKVNDAQSYITFEEWVRRITQRGQLDEYAPLIEAILDESKPITTDMLEKFVQVQKNYYFDFGYNSGNKVMAPRQIKNAEFVLVPRFIKGTELQLIYETMVENNIDQLNTVETSKASNTNILELFDAETGQLTQEKLDAFKTAIQASNVVSRYDYTYLYTQQETPQHMNADNKLGTQFAKRIVDALPERLKSLKEKFFDIDSANIASSAQDLLMDLRIEMSKDGSIKLDDAGNILSIDVKRLLELLKDDGRRAGLNSNQLEYFQLIDELETGLNETVTDPTMAQKTVMPLYMSNIAPKAQSMLQSLFNNHVTRQLMHGYHAVQVTDVGWRKFKRNEGGFVSDPDDNLKYHKDGVDYIEVKVPRSAFNFDEKKIKRWQITGMNADEIAHYKLDISENTPLTDEQVNDCLIKELQEAKLDNHIIYRIPTEGQQSMAIAKIVGFTNPAYGSCIVVPNEWVAQTGADFDIDTIYAMTHSTRVNKDTGRIERVPFYEGAEYDRQLYVDYIRNKINTLGSLSSERQTIAKRLKKVREANRIKKELISLEKAARQGIKDAQDKESKAAFGKQLVEITQEIKKQDDIISSNAVNDAYYFNLGNDESIFDTFEEFRAKNSYMKNSREARNNELLDTIMELLSDLSSVEKQTFRSNFDDISKVKKELISEDTKTARKQRNVHNMDDVAAYQSELASGRAIKGISVMLDNAASILGSVQATLPGNVEILYDEVDEDETGRSVEYETVDGQYLIKHNRIGWSLNHRNIEGLPLLPYSSETTAYMLDIGKEGALDNVNIETFDVFKLFSMVGSTYSAAISFMGLEGVKEIVDVIESNKSIFAVGHQNEINQAIVNIAKKYKLKINDGKTDVTDTTSVRLIIQALDKEKLFRVTMPHIKNYKATNGVDLRDDVDNPSMFDNLTKPEEFGAQFPINVGRNKRAVKKIGEFAPNASSPVKDMTIDEFNLYFELATVFKYAHLKKFGSMLMNVANKINPDSFGAKATLYANNKVFDDMFDAIANGGTLPMVGDKNVYEAIYPGLLDSFDAEGLDNINVLSKRQEAIDNFITSDRGNESAYKPLYYFLKYATGTSQKVSRLFLPTQNISFRYMVNRIKDVFTAGKRLDEATYNNVESFFINHIYHDTMLISSTLTIDKESGEIVGMRLNSMNPDIDETLKDKTPSQLDREARLRETRRICGYDYNSDLVYTDKNGEYRQFKVADINNPTQEEIDNFAELTPAQKIAWIKIHFPEDAGIFTYIETSLSNNNSSYYRSNRQTISSIEGNINIEYLFRTFNDTFNNTNPLLKLAAVDAMKYAFVMESFKNRRHSITQITTNHILRNTTEDANMVDEIRMGMNQLVNTTDEEADAILHAYVRANAFSMKQISEFELKKNKNGEYNFIGGRSIGRTGIIRLPAIKRHIDEKGADVTYKELQSMIHYNVVHYVSVSHDSDAIEYEADRYIKFKTGNTRTLYKIVGREKNTYLVPINLLEETENPTNEFSINPKNNRFAPYDILMEIIDEAEEHGIFVTNDILESWNVKSDQSKHKDYTAKSSVKTVTVSESTQAQVISKTKGKDANDDVYIRSEELKKAIAEDGAKALQFEVKSNTGTKTYIAFKMNLSQYKEQFKFGTPFTSTKINPNLRAFLNDARKNTPNIDLEDVFVINEYVDFTPSAAVTEEESSVSYAGLTFAKAAYAQSELAVDADDDKDISKILADIKKYRLKDELEIINNPVRAYSAFTDYAEKRAKHIVEKMDGITQVLSTGEVLKIDDDSLPQHMLADKALADRVEKFIISTCHFLNSAKDIVNLHPDDVNDDLKPYVNRIKHVIETISQERIDKAVTNYVTKYIQPQSGNPLYGTNNVTGAPILDIRNGFYKTSFVERWIGDVQESPNPLVQYGASWFEEKMKEYAVKGKRASAEFIAKYDDIDKRATSAGQPIDKTHIVDDNGDLYNPYTQEFLDEYQRLSDNVANIARLEGTHSVNYLIADIEKKKFKLKHLQQPLEDAYYAKEIAIKETMLRQILKYPKVRDAYERYFALSKERTELFKDFLNSGDTTRLDRIRVIRQELKDIRQEYEESPLDGTMKLSIVASSINSYVAGLRDLDSTYMDRETNVLFREQLSKHLKTVQDFEEQNADKSVDWFYNQRLKGEDYGKAITWIENNAEYIASDEIIARVSKAYSVLTSADRDNKIDASKGQRSKAVREILKVAKAYDEHGVPDGRKLDDTAITSIRDYDNMSYTSRIGGAMADSTIMGNKVHDTVVYKPEVYAHLTSPADVAHVNDWKRTAYKINAILNRARQVVNGKVEINPAVLSLEDLKTLDGLFTVLEGYKKNTNSSEEVHNYLSQNFAKQVNMALYNKHSADGRVQQLSKGTEYYEALQRVIRRPSRRQLKGTTNQTEPNPYLYQELIVMPGKENLIDARKTEAVKVLKDFTTKVPNRYFHLKYAEVRNSTNDQNVIDEWIANNTVYNPYTHSLEPLSCWTETGLKDFGYVTDPTTGQQVLVEGAKKSVDNYRPTWLQETKSYSQEHLNKAYSDKGLRFNYKTGNEYDRVDNKTSYEKEIEKLLVDTCSSLAHSGSARKFFEEGKLPHRNKTEHTNKQKALNFIGLTATKPNEKWIEDQEIDMSINQAAIMPYLNDLRWNEKTTPEDYNDDREREKYRKHGKENEYNELLKKKAEDFNKTAKEHNERILVDKDIRAIMSDFIRKAYEYNAIYDNQAKLFMIQKELQQYKVYAYNRGAKFLPKRRRGVETPEYSMTEDTNALAQWNNFIRRTYYRVYKEDHGFLTQLAGLHQNFTSAKFMMMNVHGGIANVTVGLSGMIAEGTDSEHFDSKALLKGMNFYLGGTHRYMHGFGEANPIGSMQLQLIDLYEVVDYDAFRQTVSTPGMEQHWARAKEIAYTPQTMGEHFMQNSVLFAMMEDNVVVERPTYVDGRSKYIAMSKQEYVSMSYIKAMKTFLSPSQYKDFEMYVDLIKAKPERLREYALFQEDFVANYLRTHCSIDEIKRFIAIRKELEKQALADYAKEETVMSQYTMDSNGKLALRPGSKFELAGQDEHDKFVGHFGQKVISVNKKIHGVYDKLGSAMVEKALIGGCLMQYHKHLWPGILKRYRIDGMYNESRRSIERGWVQSLYRFLSIPIRENLKGYPEDTISTLENIQRMFGNITYFIANMKTYYGTLSPKDQANIRAWLGDWAGIVGAIGMGALMYAVGAAGDDDDEVGFLSNLKGLGLYEANRLFSETVMWGVLGAKAEAKTLWSSPIAAQGISEDIIDTMGFISELLINDDFEMTYKTGAHAGENKFIVKIMNEVPLYRTINRLFYMNKSNKYYRIGDNNIVFKYLKNTFGEED